MELCEEHGDRPITIRTLTEIAEREGWSLDTRLSVEDVETEEKFFARGVSIMPGRFGDEDWTFDLHFVHEDEWELVQEREA